MSDFLRPQRLDALPAHGLTRTITAEPADLPGLAERMQVPAIASLSCDWHLVPAPRGRALATGTLRARLTRICVITLDEFETDIEDRFTVHFVPEGQETDDEDPEAPDELPYQGTTIDLGAATAEQFALALDPYPRKPGAELPAIDSEDDHPFAALRRLKS